MKKISTAGFWRRAAYATACAATLILPAGCATGSAADFCLLYVPVYSDEADTRETRAQIDANNAVWMALCEEPQKGYPARQHRVPEAEI